MAIFDSMISPSLKLEVTKQIFAKVIARNSVFEGDN